MESDIPEELLTRLSASLVRQTGWHFPRERWPELRRGIAGAARQLGFEQTQRWAGELADATWFTRQQIEALAAHLTVGETYFFREPRHFDFLARRVIPELLERTGRRRLRIWSAGCCTGEEAYSIAILLRREIPDLAAWQVSVLGTDINPVFLGKARKGVFAPWSFREVPEGVKARHFRALPGGYLEVLPEVRRLVQFAAVNLADEAYSAVMNDASPFDVIFCRNVLMYFEPGRARKVIERMYRFQEAGGWLLVGSSELPHLTGTCYATVQHPEVIAFQRVSDSIPSAFERPAAGDVPLRTAAGEGERCVDDSSPDAADYSPAPAPPGVDGPLPDAKMRAMQLCALGQHREAVLLLESSVDSPGGGADVEALRMLTRCLADLGELERALECCDRAIAGDKCSPASQYLRAEILRELGSVDAAMQALRSVLFLDPRFVMAHVSLAGLTRSRGQVGVSRQHARRALDILRTLPSEEIIPESDGTTARSLAAMIVGMDSPPGGGLEHAAHGFRVPRRNNEH
jgi:chemotaxis protein methyltransferase CheR